MAFEKIEMAKWPRREHFAYYSNCLKTNYQITVEMDITQLYKNGKAGNFRFFPSYLYAIMKGINQNKEFRMEYHEETLGYWDICHPSYTIFHEDDKTFSDIWSEYNENFAVFYQNVVRDMEEYKEVKGVKTKPGRPQNACPVSALPWLSYVSVNHDTTGPTSHYFPVINFGRFTSKENKVVIPFSIYVNHAAADGYHTSLLIQDIEEICRNAETWMKQ